MSADDATVAEGYEGADLVRAIQAYKFFYPTVSGAAIIKGNAAAGMVPNRVFGILDCGPEQLVFTANSDTPYGPLLLDLADGPLVVELPPGPLIVCSLDINQRWVADMGLPGPDAGNGGKHLLLGRMAEVYAALSEYTDVQIGRLIDYLDESGQLDNTLIFYCADNGASGEGSPNGSVNENRFFNGYPDDIADNLAMLDSSVSPNLQPLPHWVGRRIQYAVPDVQALFAVRGRHRGPVDHPLAEGFSSSRRGPRSVPSLHRHRADDSRVLRTYHARCRRRRSPDAAFRGVDALQLR